MPFGFPPEYAFSFAGILISLSIAVSALAFCAFIAAIIPAGRAAAIEPMRALRME
jgi:ABC-type lipoprotein release transport system permease subunit